MYCMVINFSLRDAVRPVQYVLFFFSLSAVGMAHHPLGVWEKDQIANMENKSISIGICSLHV